MTKRRKPASKAEAAPKPAPKQAAKETAGPGVDPRHVVVTGRRLIVTREVLAAMMGVNPDTITDATRDGMPVLERGGHSKRSRYDAIECLAWQRGKIGRNAKENAQTRMFMAQAEVAEIKARTQRGELVSRDVVVREGRSFAKAIAAKLRVLPRRFVQIGLIEPSEERAAAEHVREMLDDVSRWTADKIEAVVRAEGASS